MVGTVHVVSGNFECSIKCSIEGNLRARIGQVLRMNGLCLVSMITEDRFVLHDYQPLMESECAASSPSASTTNAICQLLTLYHEEVRPSTSVLSPGLNHALQYIT